MDSTIIVNMRYAKATVNCGRGSIYGNPYRIGVDGTRDEVCDKYIIYFNKRLLDEKFRAKVLALRGHRLGCWCKPKRCHLETIVEFINKNETG